MLEADDYYPFGLDMPGRSSTGTPVRQGFTGYWRDGESGLGLYYSGARMYSPGTGRFFGVDPLAEDFATWSPYAYTFNNPVNWRDPDGRSANCMYCTITVARMMLAAINTTYEFNANASVTAGLQVAGVVEVSGAKVGVNLNAGSLDVLAFNQSNTDLSTTGLTSELRTQRREFEVGAVVGISKSETATVSSLSTSSLQNPQIVEKSTHLGVASIGSVQDSGNASIHATTRLSMNFAFGLGFRISVEVRALAKDEDVAKYIKSNTNEEQ